MINSDIKPPNNSCEYQVAIDLNKREWKCMTAQEYRDIPKRETSATDIIMVGVIIVFVIGFACLIAYLINDSIA